MFAPSTESAISATLLPAGWILIPKGTLGVCAPPKVASVISAAMFRHCKKSGRKGKASAAALGTNALPERWIPVTWPGTGSPRGGVLTVRGAGFTDEIPRLGDFGLFRLFEAGGLKPGALAEGTQVLSGSWTLSRAGEAPVTIDVRPAKTVHPFARGMFRRLRCPPSVTSAVSPR